MSAQSSDRPDIRTSNPFEKRVISELSKAKPGRSVGFASRPLPGGTSLVSLHRRTRSAGGGDAPVYRLWLTKDSPGYYYVTYGEVTYGSGSAQTVRMGSVGGSELDNDSPILVNTTNARFWLVFDFNMTFEQGWFVGATLNGVYVDYGSTVPAHNPSGGKFYKELGRVVSDAITRNYEGYSLYAMLRDDSSVSATNVAFALGRVS